MDRLTRPIDLIRFATSHGFEKLPASVVGKLPNEHSAQSSFLDIVALGLDGLDTVIRQDQALLLVPQIAPGSSIVELVGPVRVLSERLLNMTVFEVSGPAHVVFGGVPRSLDSVSGGGHGAAHTLVIGVVEHVSISGNTKVQLGSGNSDLLELRDRGVSGNVAVQRRIVSNDLGPVSGKVLSHQSLSQ